jgi:two-component system response regulator PilR (NtrC family)
VPALRERASDISEIADAILQRLGRRTNTQSPQLSPEAIELLQGHPFPGNVRELENVLERALTLCTGGHDHSRAHQACAPQHASGPRMRPPRSRALTNMARGSKLEDMERDAIVKALEKTRYNKTAAAKLLGHELPRAALPHQEARHRRLKEV